MTWPQIVLAVLLGLALASIGGMAVRLVNQRREVQRLSELVRWRADQMSVLSHELRTPLTLIKLSGDLLAGRRPGQLTETQARFVTTICEQTQVMTQLTEDLLVEARIEAGQFTLHLTLCDVGSLVLDCATSFRSLHGERIIVDCPSRPCRVRADVLLIRQALTNLVNNAVAVSPDPAPVVIRVNPHDYDVLISVSDQGFGISAQQRLALFRRFASSRPLRSGTGLGLLITKQIVELHGGRLFIDSWSGQGTVMTFNLPTAGPQLEGSRHD
jgi:signal transduction histidine kinase